MSEASNRGKEARTGGGPTRITSAKNPRVQRTVRLRQSRERKKTGLFVIDGLREIQRADEAGIAFEEIFMRPPGDLPLCTSEWLAARRESRNSGDAPCEWIEVSENVFSKLAYGDRNDGIIVVARRRQLTVDMVLPPTDEPSLIVIVEGLENPGNLGAILRTSDAVGVHALLLVDAEVDDTNPNVIRASMGAAFSVPVIHATPAEAKEWCRSHHIALLAARVDSEQEYYEVDLRQSVAIVLGNEARGLSDEWHPPAVTPIGLPMAGLVDSLNVSVTAGVVLYEARRQRAK